jgi:heme o synthase
MSVAFDQITTTAAASRGGDVRDYFALLKPRVMSLVVLTAVTGLVVAPGSVHPVIGFVAILMVAIGAGASGCLNMWYDADIDSVMRRTATRPIPGGRITQGEALAFGVTLSVASVLVLGLVANWVAAGLLAFTIFFYAVVYSMWLKRSTPQNIVIGGAAGAFPPMIGEAIATGSIGWTGVVLFAIIFLWTPPHFWALAIPKSADYAAAGVPMMPNARGEAVTRRQIFLYTLVMLPVTALPVAMGFGGALYALTALIGGGAMLWCAVQVLRITEGDAGKREAFRMFGISILYLFGLFIALLVERLPGLFWPLVHLG